VMNNARFARETFCDSRNLCRQAMWMRCQANVLALGRQTAGENAVVFDGDHSPQPGRSCAILDEPVRHKMLDGLGRSGAGMRRPYWTKYTGVRAGHSLTNTLLRRACSATPGAGVMVECDAQMASASARALALSG